LLNEVTTTTIHRKEFFPMNHFTSNLVQALVTKQDATKVVRSYLELAMNHLFRNRINSVSRL